MTVYKKRLHLKNFDYKGRYRYFLTICCFKQTAKLKDYPLIKWLTNVLAEKAERYGFKIWAYCFMPDHLHLLVEGENENSDMKQFVKSYKQITGFYFKRMTGERLWQINFYEHTLRKEEDTIKTARYIFNNPVRKGMVDDYRKYEFLGSFEFDIKQT